MEDKLNASLNKLDEYFAFLNSSAKTLNAASLVGREKDIAQIVHQMESVLNEIDREVSNLKIIDIEEETINSAINEKILQILLEAARITEKRK